MRFFAVAIVCFLFTSNSFAQDGMSWNIYHNNRKLLTGYDHFFNEKKYTLYISSPSLDSAGVFVAEFSVVNPASIHAGWIRIMEITDKSGYRLFSKDSTSHLEINNGDLKKIVGHRKKIKAYTWAYPPPESGIKAKIRKIQLCTLRLR